MWNPDFRISGDEGDVLPGLTIKDKRTRQRIELGNYRKPLIEYPEFIDIKGHLLAENDGWQLDMPFCNKDEAIKIVDLFLRKSGLKVYDHESIEIEETIEQMILRAPWPDAYRIPVLILGESTLTIVSELPHFDQATKLCLTENNNEISLIIHRGLDILKNLQHYEALKKAGFTEQVCLGNRAFLEYLDDI